MTSPVDDETDWRRARREVARGHHPDVGGDAATFVHLLAEVDRRYGRGGGPQIGVVPLTPRIRVQRGVRRVARRAKAHSRTLRTRLPRSVPGSKRYFQL